MTKDKYQEDTNLLSKVLGGITDTRWDGRQCILELKKVNFQWRQMEWMGFYFEFLCRKLMIHAGFSFPGKKYDKVEFDSFRSINWDIKTSAIKSSHHRIILNDKNATEESIDEFGCHGLILALVDVEYNDDERTFQKWHDALKGEPSNYVKKNRAKNVTSRYRKTQARLEQILLLVMDGNNLSCLDTHRQGRNSNDNARNLKYSLDVEQADIFEVDRINF